MKINFEKYKDFENITKEGYRIKIIDFRKYDDVTSEFDNGHRVIGSMKEVIEGSIRNPYHKSIYNIGYIGVGKYSSGTKVYSSWYGMFERCYDKELQKVRVTYIDCSVDERWHNFQTFGDWFEENYNYETMQGWHLDKDILFKGNKTYSPESCCFVPNEINTLIVNRKNKRGEYPIGVRIKGKRFEARVNKNGISTHIGTFDTPEEAFQAYKVVKEQHIKEVADKWRGKITEQVYQVLYNWRIETTD